MVCTLLLICSFKYHFNTIIICESTFFVVRFVPVDSSFFLLVTFNRRPEMWGGFPTRGSIPSGHSTPGYQSRCTSGRPDGAIDWILNIEYSILEIKYPIINIQ